MAEFQEGIVQEEVEEDSIDVESLASAQKTEEKPDTETQSADTNEKVEEQSDDVDSLPYLQETLDTDLQSADVDDDDEEELESDQSLLSVQSNEKTLDIDAISAEINNRYQTVISQKFDANAKIYLPTSLGDSKSNEVAAKIRMAGNKIRQEGNLEKALSKFTETIVMAKTDTKELVLAYDDRSYVLFKLGRYKSCMNDMNRAMKMSECPPAIKRKLIKRYKECLMLDSTTDEETNNLGWHDFCNFEPTNVLSPKLELDYDEEQGKILIATEDVQPGEILSIEDFYVMDVNGDNYLFNCSFCLLKCDCSIPCPDCTRIMYCSEKCRKEAFDSFHRSECKISLIYDYTEERTAPLALQMFLIGTEQGKQLKNLMEELKPSDIFIDKFDSDPPQFVRNYRSSLQMCKMTDRIHDIEDAIESTVNIIIALLRASFFGENNAPERLNEEELFAALLLINHIITVNSNDFSITTDMVPKTFLEKCEINKSSEEFLGYGICLSQNLMEYSCHANTSNFVQNRQRIVFATRTILPGEQVTNAIQQWFPVMTLDERADNYMRFGFECACDACMEDWPQYEDLRLVQISFSSLDVVQIKMDELKLKVDALVRGRPMELLNVNESLQMIIAHLKMLCEVLETPSYDIYECEQLLVAYMLFHYCEHHRFYQNRIKPSDPLVKILNSIMERIQQAHQTKLLVPRVSEV